jgi:hypothetical protein
MQNNEATVVTQYDKKQEFLRRISGKTQKYKRYLGSPLRYAGGKSNESE